MALVVIGLPPTSSVWKESASRSFSDFTNFDTMA